MDGAGIALVAGAGIAGLAWLIAVQNRRSGIIDKVAHGVVALGEGRPVRPISDRCSGAAGRLSRAYNEAAPHLEARIARLEGDRQLLRTVLGSMAEGVIAVDGRRRLLFANDAAQHLLGLGPGAEGRLLAERIRSPQVHEVVEATLSSPAPYRGEIAVSGPQGRPRVGSRVLAVHGTPLPGTPPPGAVLVFHDITETRRLERVRQDFVANASHELKTPLASIKAYTETLLDWALHDESVNVTFLRRIDEQASRLDQLILDMLSLARLESGQEPFEHGPLVLAPVVRQAAESHRARAEAKGLQLDLAVDAHADGAVVTADEEAIRQILDNLIDNAIKYTPAGGRIRVALNDEGGGGVVLAVADSGIGIPREDLPRVFERFYRVDRARSRELGGTGLGLSIVKHLVGSLGGRITVESRPGHGTTFAIQFPPGRAPAAEASRPQRV